VSRIRPERGMSIVIPTYGRNAMLVDSIRRLLALSAPADELLVLDQTATHDVTTETVLSSWERERQIRWIRLRPPGVVAAMNRGLQEATGDSVLFLDDDIIPDAQLIAAHRQAYTDYPEAWAVVGRVIQPEVRGQRSEVRGQKSEVGGRQAGMGCSRLREDLDFDFDSDEPAWVANVMAGNLSVRRDRALEIGGFDERFIPPVSFRFETDFARRIIAAGGKIRFEPKASIHHLRAPRGGTRSIGSHLTSASPLHGVGDYCYALKHGKGWDPVWYIARRPFREVCTKFHLRHPWWIPVKFAGELRAIIMALRLFSNHWKEKPSTFPIVGNPDDRLMNVLLIHTCPPDRPNGSMVRYGDMVREALRTHAGDCVNIQEIHLAPPQSRLNRFPEPLQTLLRYLFIAWNARRLLPRHQGEIWHLLDGSHAYAMGGIQKYAASLVVTIHDTIPLMRVKEHWPESRSGRIGSWVVRKTAKNWSAAHHLVAVSGKTRDDVIQHTGCRAGRVSVVHNAVGATKGAAHTTSVPDGYILHVAGNNTFYKNRRGVVDIVKLIRESEPITLVMAGALPDRALELHVQATDMTEHVQFRSNLTENELVQLYRHATFLLFPSLYEGFGWPPLEAMREGCPVLCSNAGSLPEIVGEAAWLAEPKDVERFAKLGIQLLRDEVARSQLISRGNVRVKSFNLEALADGLVRAYRQAQVERA